MSVFDELNNEMTSARPKSKYKRINNLIFAIVSAIAIWFGVVYTVNPDISINVPNASVRVTGELALRDKGLVWVNRNELPEFSVKISGKRSDLISALDRVRVDLDLSNIETEGSTALTPIVYVPSSITLEKQRFTDVSIVCETLYQKDIPVTIKQINETKELLVRSISQESTVNITGSKKEVDSIGSCLITVDLASITKDTDAEYSFSFQDKNGAPIVTTDTVLSSIPKIKVTNTVYERTVLPVKISVSDELSREYTVTISEKNISPSQAIAGIRGEAPDFINAVFPYDNYENGIGEYTLYLTEPENVYIPEKTVKVRAELEKKIPIIASVPLTAANLDPGRTLISIPSHADVRVLAPPELKDSITGVVDLAGLSAGYHRVKVTFTDSRITSVKDCYADIMLQ